MTSLQNLLCKKDKVLCLLEQSATKAHEGVQELVKTCNEPDAMIPAENVLFCRVAERKITEEIRKELYSTPSPPLHALELERLSEALYKIPKIASKFREQFAASPEFVRKVDFNGQLSLAEQASALLVRMVKSLQGHLDLPLDDIGAAQVAEVARWVGRPDRLISSPLLRARQTAEAFDVPYEVDPRWIELDYGEYDGMPLGDVPAATAILDRFLHHAQVIAITGRSYRLRNTSASALALSGVSAAGLSTSRCR